MENIDLSNVNRQFLEQHSGHHNQHSLHTQHSQQTAPSFTSLGLHSDQSYSSLSTQYSSGVADSYVVPHIAANFNGHNTATIGLTLYGSTENLRYQEPDSPDYFSESFIDSPYPSPNQSPDMRSHPDQENFRHRRHRRKKGMQQQVQQRQAANLRERRRMQSINDAFEVSHVR